MTEALRIYGDVAARLRSHFAGIKVAFAKTGKAAEQAVLGLNVFGAIMDEANDERVKEMLAKKKKLIETEPVDDEA